MQRTVTGDDEVHPARRLDELQHALLGREAAGVEHLGRLRFLAHRRRQVDAARNHPHLPGPELPSRVREGVRGHDHEPGAPQHTAREPRRTPRELDIRAPDLNDVRRAGPCRHPARRDPVGVQEISIHPAGGAHEAREQRGDEQHEPRPAPQIADDPVSVGDPVVTELLRPNDLDLDPARTDVVDRVRNEPAGRIPGEARI